MEELISFIMRIISLAGSCIFCREWPVESDAVWRVCSRHSWKLAIFWNSFRLVSVSPSSALLSRFSRCDAVRFSRSLGDQPLFLLWHQRVLRRQWFVFVTISSPPFFSHLLNLNRMEQMMKLTLESFCVCLGEKKRKMRADGGICSS